MVASDSEAKDIAKVMCQWMPTGHAIDMIQEIWNDVGAVTENVSLRDSILLLMYFLEENDKEINYGGTERTS